MDDLVERVLAAEEMFADRWQIFWAHVDRYIRRHQHVWAYVEVLFMFLMIYPALSHLWDRAAIVVNSLIENTDVRYSRPPQVLVWWAHTLPFTTIPNGSVFVTPPCPPVEHNVCYVTMDRGSINTSDAIVFDAESVSLADLPPYRHQSQAWVFFALGPPLWPPSQDLLQTAALFNWTMAFREDADIVIPYKTWSPASDKTNVSKLAATTRGKARTAVWMISECEKQKLEIAGSSSLDGGPWSGTERFVNTVLQRVDVDVIFDCGHHFCASTHGCLGLLEDKYDFVFVTESSICFEHPAQLIYDSFYYDIIAVFFGVGDFKHPLPPDTFIDTSKLEDPSDVVDILKKVGASPQAYANFMTKRQSFLLMPPVDTMCALCHALHEPPKKPLLSNSLLWWQSRSDCSVYTAAQMSESNITKSADAGSSTHLE